MITELQLLKSQGALKKLKKRKDLYTLRENSNANSYQATMAVEEYNHAKQKHLAMLAEYRQQQQNWATQHQKREAELLREKQEQDKEYLDFLLQYYPEQHDDIVHTALLCPPSEATDEILKKSLLESKVGVSKVLASCSNDIAEFLCANQLIAAQDVSYSLLWKLVSKDKKVNYTVKKLLEITRGEIANNNFFEIIQDYHISRDKASQLLKLELIAAMIDNIVDLSVIEGFIDVVKVLRVHPEQGMRLNLEFSQLLEKMFLEKEAQLKKLQQSVLEASGEYCDFGSGDEESLNSDNNGDSGVDTALLGGDS